jgi:predicted glycosyltransferase
MEEGRSTNLPPNVDYLSLPALHKNGEGKYQPRRLELPLQALIAMRSQVIQAALKAFAPDLFIVDNVPRGAVRELNPALAQLRSQGQTRIVLGLRDVLDEPKIVQQEWQHASNEEAIAQYYDAVWVYGDPAVFDLTQEYRFLRTVASKIRYVGYFDQRQRLQYLASPETVVEDLCLPPGKLALCLVGGGQDGAALAQQFAQATLPPDTNGVILTGPFMSESDRQHLQACAATQPRLRIVDYLEEPTQLLKQADSVVSMGGYNTTCELLSFGKRSLIVPRVTPRLEQWIRAKRLQDLGWIDVLHPDHLSPETLSNWLAQQPTTLAKARSPIDLNGLDRLPELVIDVLTQAALPAPVYCAS